jgi:replicative DNA helicase
MTAFPMAEAEVLAEEPGRFRSLEAETSVLSALMNFPDALDEVVDRLQPKHFLDQQCRLLFVAIRRKLTAGAKVLDVVSLHEDVKDSMTFAEVHQISQTHDHSPRGIVAMADVLIDRYKARELHRLSQRMAELAFGTAPVRERIDVAQAELAKLADEDARTDEWVFAEQAMMEHLDLIDRREQGLVTGLPSGLVDLDQMLDGGFQRGNLVVIGARPAMGKTAMAMTIGLSMAQRVAVGFLSMEMPHADLRDRQLSMLAGEPIAKLKRPGMGLDYGRVLEAVERGKALRFYASDRPGLNILQVRSKARALRRRFGLDVLVVDYIGLMEGLDKRQNRAYQIEEISRGLKNLAKELDLVVICLAQVNRGAADKGGNQPPALHELRDSGAIEQDADVVAFLHRPVQQNPNLGGDWAHYALMRVAKNRQGRTGDVHLFYQGELTKFAEWAGEPPTATPATKRGGGHDDY